ncbi:MAG: prolyl oligopeptidase family serine peptidase [Thermoguttaceae bacterium]|jgi:dipeptidyl aminopeptidase/acylaminoacyl peptidase
MRSFRVPIIACSPLLWLFLFAHTVPADIVPGDNLVIAGIPSIPASIAETTNRYTEFRNAFLLDWHPVEQSVLISTRFAETNQVHLVNFPGGARSQLTFFPDRVGGAAFQPTTGHYFLFAKDVGGGEWFQFYRYDFSSGDSRLLTDGKSRNIGARWNHSGDRIVYCSTRRNGKDTDIWMLDPRDPKTDRLLLKLEGGGWAVGGWSFDDKQLALLEMISANESYVWVADVATGEKRLITPKAGVEKVSYDGAEFSKDGRGLYVTTDKDSEFHRLTYIDLGTGRHTYLTSHIMWDVSEFKLSEDGATLAYVTNEDGISVLRLLDTATRKERPVPKLPAGVIALLHWHKNSRDLGMSIISPQSPGDVYSVNTRTGKLDRWTYGETGGLNTSLLPDPELVRWKSFDGRMISGFLYRPPARFTGKRPAIVHIHGGPESQFRPMFIGRDNYFLCELGVAILFPNVRGSSGYGKTFLTLDNGFKREDSYKDIGALLDWIKTRPDLDGDRIMVTGASYGGHMTLAVATYYPDKIRCALDVVGPSNLVTFLEHTEAYRRDLRRVEYGDERDPKMREFLERTAPLNNVRKISCPLLVVAGKNDPRVPASEGEQLVAALKQKNVPVWWLMAKDEGHGFLKKKNADFLFYATVKFVEEYLLK